MANRRVKYTIWDTAGKNIYPLYIHNTTYAYSWGESNSIQHHKIRGLAPKCIQITPSEYFLGLTLCSSVWFKHFKIEQCFWIFRFKSTECKPYSLDCMAMATNMIFLCLTYFSLTMQLWWYNGNTFAIRLDCCGNFKDHWTYHLLLWSGFQMIYCLGFLQFSCSACAFSRKTRSWRIILYPFEAEIPHEFALFCYTLALCSSSLELGHKT